ncbi:protein ALP1-like [Trichogramma pretiosum]|uniref:protein ALP1-like n=1 Tax=Trichogramma pretiosum TaxID=7493 RepID=UPI000C7194E4|nr:protein ALP1-like [Trichogramma pretiosum]
MDKPKVAELQNDEELFFKSTRMDKLTFEYLFSLVEVVIRPLRNRKNNVSPKERLFLTLSYLATGDDIFSIAVKHRISETSVLIIIKTTCCAIISVLANTYLRTPKSIVWKNIAKGFQAFWNMLNCIGAIDGLHIPIVAPANSGSSFFNYKKFNSIVLLGICNHRYEFTCVDIGSCGSESNGGILNRSLLGKALAEKQLNIPEELNNFPNSTMKSPYYFVGDAAFGLNNNMMRSFPGRHLEEGKKIFNYRLSRARRCIENSFGILKTRWKVLGGKPLPFSPDDVTNIATACVCLHNFLMARTQRSVRQSYCPDNFVDTSINGRIVEGQWRQEVNVDRNSLPPSEDSHIESAYVMRDNLKTYFNSPEGEVPWQKDMITRGTYRDLM